MNNEHTHESKEEHLQDNLQNVHKQICECEMYRLVNYTVTPTHYSPWMGQPKKTATAAPTREAFDDALYVLYGAHLKLDGYGDIERDTCEAYATHREGELAEAERKALRWERDYQREVLNDILSIEEDQGLTLPPTLKRLKAEKASRLDDIEAQLRHDHETKNTYR